MRRLFAMRWFQALAALFAVLCLAVLFACWRFRIWTYADYLTYNEVRRYPIGDDLWLGRIKAGQDLEAFTTAHPPHRTRRFGRFTQMTYYTGGPPQPGSIAMESMSVIAADSRLVHAVAAGCTWDRVFFEMSPGETAEFQEAFERHLREKGWPR
jgi:hypothetical protein